ncbi:hypothetical protein ACFFMR_29080 [Micromonospora andamanensis]|uniref:Uncharacterized protein n=1 Tax=Micromonospora andamanensis TaxID=1287068 RepID=A0ABQ4I3Y3_9ACTN|nr:hypothetical protein [Micromonospora andamanensis]GIJ12609.1 hypothetical protein Van01_58230 [Micromonospora andamanensis]
MTFPQLGDVIEVGEQDYMHGTGHLTLRITCIGDQVRVYDDEWLKVEGLALRADGTQLDPNPRPALVRMRALHIAPSSGSS